MRYLAIATDFDGVVASHGRVSSSAMAAIERLRASGRRAILVTGRSLESLQQSCPDLSTFDYVVVENGAVVYEPRTRQETLLAKPLPAEFAQRLKELGVDPLEVGKVIVATWTPHQNTMLQVVQELGLEVHIVFNRAAVMVLPPGVNKATGMIYVLRKLGLSAHEVVGIGDSENDHSFLERSECAATVANAVPSIRAIASIIASRENGAGVAELIDDLIATDFSHLRGRIEKHLFPIGLRTDGATATVSPYGHNILIAGPSGTGKSTVTAGIVERLMKQQYQVCIIDPEGDYGTLPDVITLGNQNHAVTVNEVLSFIEDPKVTLNVNLFGIPLADRPAFFGQLFPNLQAMRTRTGRPHWIVLDEAHHMLPPEWSHLDKALVAECGGNRAGDRASGPSRSNGIVTGGRRDCGRAFAGRDDKKVCGSNWPAIGLARWARLPEREGCGLVSAAWGRTLLHANTSRTRGANSPSAQVCRRQYALPQLLLSRAG